jgi:transcriptional regulator with XRE-family HTH domain
MKFSEYKKRLELDPEYQQTKSDLRLAFALANAVLAARLDKGWTQTELARRVGTKQANISRLEAGLANPTLEFIQKVCLVLGLKPAFLMEEISLSDQSDSPVEDELITALLPPPIASKVNRSATIEYGSSKIPSQISRVKEEK